MAKYKTKKKISPVRVEKAIDKQTAPKASPHINESKEKCSPKEIKKFTSNGPVSSLGKAFKRFLGIKK